MGTSPNPPIGLPVSQGQLVAGKYRIDYVLGERGTGVVMAAEHLALRQYVAIKVLRTSATAEHVERFFREARAAASIASDHVVRVVDLDRLETGEPYIVMELLQGKTLAALLAAEGPMPVAQAVDYVMHACEAVGKAHAAGIVHRELKPANLFLTKDERGGPCVKVLDFGICKLAAGGSGGPSGWITAATTLLGSPSHMAPEQWVSATDVDARADVWALGTILYELLAGRPAFAGDDLGAICDAVQHREPPALAALRPDVPVALQSIIASCLAKPPEQRPATAALVGVAIAPWATAIGHAVLDEIGRLTADPSRPEVAGKAPTMVASIRDPRMEGSTDSPGAHPIVAAPTVAVRGVTVHDPAIAGSGPARTASGTIQLAAQPDPPVAAAAVPPTVRMASVPPAPPAAAPPPLPPFQPAAPTPPPTPYPAAYPSAPTPYPPSQPSAPPPTPVPYPAPLPPTVIGPHVAEGRAPVPWLLIVVVAICILAVVGVTTAWLLSGQH